MTTQAKQKNTETQKEKVKNPADFSPTGQNKKLPDGWVKTTLGEVCEKIGDGLHGTPKYLLDGEYYFVNGNNLKDGKIILKNDTKRVSEEEFLKYKKDLGKNTILLSINGTIGNLAKYNNEKCILGKSAAYLNIKQDVNVNFIYYLMLDNKFQYDISKNANGSTIKNVSLAQLRNYNFLLPPLPQQKAIAKMLSAFDDKIELLREQNETLEKIGETIFKEWFGKYKVGDDLLDGWRVGKIGDVVNIKQGKYIKANLLSENKTENKKYPVYGGNGIRGYIEDFVYKKPQVILTCRGNGCGLIQLSDEKSTITNSCMAFEIEDSKLSTEYIYFWSKRINFESVTSGSAQPQITVTNLYGLEIIIPSDEILEKFNQAVKPLFEKIKNNSEQIQTLAKTRDTLLPKLMKGEIILTEK